MASISPAEILLTILAILLVLFLPGWTWQAWFLHSDRDTVENLAEAAALSIAATAIFALGAFLVGLRFDAASMAVIYGVLVILCIAGWLRRAERTSHHLGSALVAWLLFGIFVAWRLYQARDLVLPAWVDSVHHTLIVRVFLEQGGLSATLLPYLDVPLSYHYAFHIVAAAFDFWSGLSLDRAVLIFGQVINALVGLSIYRLGKAVWGDWKRALAAALLATFFAHMPAYYLTWGRYTLLTGLVILPVAMSTAFDIYKGRSTRTAWILLALLTAGTLLAHYLAAILLAAFFIILGLGRLVPDLRQRRLDWSVWRPLLLGAMVGLLIASPWLWRVWEFSRWGFRLDVITGAAEPDQVYFSGYLNYLGYLLGPRRNYVLIALGGLGLILGLVRRPARPLAVWAVFIGLQTIPWGLRLGPFRPDHLAIVWFLPLSLLAADLLFFSGEMLDRIINKRWGQLVVLLAILMLCIWGARETASILNPVTILADADDVQAIHWVEANTPTDAKFWINTAYWQGGIYRGVDGGWWIEPLTGRATQLPPAFYSTGSQEYANQITQWAQTSSQITGCTQQLADLIQETASTYIYLHAGKGSLQPDALQNCAGYQLVYQQGQVWIFQVQ